MNVTEADKILLSAVPVAAVSIPPICRAVAVVIVARFASPELARIAIPLILKPIRPRIVLWERREGRPIDPMEP